MRAVSIAIVALLGACSAEGETPAADAGAWKKTKDAFVPQDAPEPRPTIVYVVRHAEAASPLGDPSLSEEGVARAQRLASLMADKQLVAIETTELKRTYETGKIVADHVGLTVEVQPIGDTETYPARLAAHVKEQHAGASTLIVGHSNTVPPTVEALSGQSVPPILPIEYDRLYTITISPDGTAELTSGTY